MEDLWGILGYDDVASDIVEVLGTDGVGLIQGPPGVGKSWLAKDIGTLWDSGGGATLLAEGDLQRSDVPFHPFGFAMAPLPSSWKNVRPAIAGVARAGETLVGTAGLITSTIEAVAKLRENRRRERRRFLGDAEQKILCDLEKAGKKRPLLLIADNLHWWDSKSLAFLGSLRSESMIRAFPFLASLRILGVEASQPHQRVVDPEAHSAFLAQLSTPPYELGRIKRESFARVLLALGAPDDTSDEAVDSAYLLSGGHLALSSRCAQRLVEGGDAAILDAPSADGFLRRLMIDRADQLAVPGERAVATLQVAAALGLTFRRDELLCAVEAEDAEVARMLRHFRDENVLELSQEVGKFVHDLYREFFLTVTVVDPTTVRELLSDCLRDLRPAQYDLRCANALDADLPLEAATLAIHSGLQREREGTPWTESPGRILDALHGGDLEDVMRSLAEANRLVREYRFSECQEILDGLPRGVPHSIHAEVDYLRATCLMSTRSELDRAEGREILGSWSGFEEKEAEIGTRLNLLLLYGLSHLADKQPALDLEKEIRSFLRARAPFDISAEDALYTLDRSAGGLHNAEMTLRRNRVSAEYFGRGDDESLLRRPLEYYRCLVNLGSSLICNGRFGEAVETFREVEDLIGDYVGGVFPRTDYASMNLLLAEYRDGSVAPEAAVRRQATIVDELSAESDPFYGENALAVYLALSGENEEAISRFDRLDENLVRTRTDPEPSMAYLIRSNRCAARFVAGQRDGLSQEWAELTELVARNAYPSRLIYMRRHELMAEVLEEDQPSSAIEFDQVLIARHPHEFGPLWKNFGRGFTMPAIEFWREN